MSHRPRVFGSVVRGQQRSRSDVDLLVELDDNRSLLDQIALMHELEDLLGCQRGSCTKGTARLVKKP